MTWRSSCHAPAAVCRGRGERVEAVSADGSLPLRPGLSPGRPEHGRRLSPPDPARDGPGRSDRFWRPWPQGGRMPWGEACSTGFNPSPRRSDPTLMRVRDALANLGPSLDGP